MVDRLPRPTEGTAPRTGPLSFGQHQLWLLDRLGGGRAYLDPVGLRLRGPLDVGALRSALRGVVSRHAILRTRYAVIDNEPRQVVSEVPSVAFRYVDVAALPADRRDPYVAELVDGACRQPFDLADQAPMRMHLVRLSTDEHILLIVLHHIASDAWSRSVLASELSELYAAGAQSRPANLASLAMQYVEFAELQRGRLTGAALDRLVAFWRRRLADLPQIELPTQRARGARRDTGGAVERFTVPADLARRLTELCQRRQATPFMAFLGVFASLLSRYSGQHDVAVGVPTAGRTTVQTEALIGYFVNMLVMRVDLAGDPTFLAVLDRVRRTAFDAYAHQEMPFERLVVELGGDRDLSVNPLFQVAFAWQNTPPLRFELPGLSVETLDVGRTSAKVDLTLRLTTAPDGALGGEVEYATALFDQATAAGIAEHYQRLLRSVADRPDLAVADLTLITPRERAALLPGAIALPSCPPAESTLPALFRRQVARRPEAVAVSHGEYEITYRELDRRADKLARYLTAAGVAPDRLVAIYAEPGIDVLVALIAVLKAGGAYLPIDPQAPANRVAGILADAGPIVVLAQASLVERVPRGTTTVIDLDAVGTLVEEMPAHAAPVRLDADNLAYVIYTSGSTGRPKGVMVTHANAIRLFEATSTELPVSCDDVWTLFHSLAFDFSVWEIWGALLHGGRLVVVPAATARDPARLLELVTDRRVTVLSQTPSAFRGFAYAAIRTGAEFPALRFVIFGGEALNVASLAGWFDRYGDRRPALLNMYGITETTVHVTVRRISRADTGRYRSPIGRPLADLQLYILDSAGNLVPPDMPGELFVAGAGLTRGYLDSPAMTAERFVPNPFSARAGGRMYRTGDRGRRLPDSEIEYLGRLDDQVKIRGFRIELGEIEAVLDRHPAVSEGAVAVHRAVPGNAQLVAYIVAATDPPATATELRGYLAQQLPGYLVPALYLNVSALPRTSGGKLDRRALPAPVPARGQTGVTPEYLAPRTADEHAVAEVWSSVLGLERVGVLDNFFDLGGDSIKALQIVAALRQRGWNVTAESLFLFRSVAGIVDALDRDPEMTGTGTGSGTAPFALISPADRARLPREAVDAYPLSMTQAGMLFEMEVGQHPRPYHNVVSYPIRDDGVFCAAAIRAAVDTVVCRHEILRTSFDLTSYDESLQLVWARAAVPLEVHDLRPADLATARGVVEAAVQDEAVCLFDPNLAPLLRVQVHVYRDDRWFLTLTENHAILDGWSHHSMVAELLRLYRDIRAGAEADTAPSDPAVRAAAARFADFIALERQALQSEESRLFWYERIRTHDPLVLPVDPTVRTRADDCERVRVTYRDLESRLRALASAEGLPLKTLLLTAHLSALATVTGQRRFTTGLVGNGRPEMTGGDRVYGMFLNTIPFGAHVADSWREMLHRVYDEEMAVWPHRRYPLPAMQQDCATGERLLDVLFSYLDFHQMDRQMVDVDAVIRSLPLEFALQVTTEPGVLIVSGQPDRVDARTTCRVANAHRLALDAMAADPDGTVVLPVKPAA